MLCLVSHVRKFLIGLRDDDDLVYVFVYVKCSSNRLSFLVFTTKVEILWILNIVLDSWSRE